MKDVCVSVIGICFRMVHKLGCVRMHVLYTQYGHVSERFTYIQKFQTCIPIKLFTVVQPRWGLMLELPKLLLKSRRCSPGVVRDLLYLEWAGCTIVRSHDFPSKSILQLHTTKYVYTSHTLIHARGCHRGSLDIYH